MVEVQAYQRSYFDLLQGMLSSQNVTNQEDITEDSIPEIGFMAFEGSIPVAAAFLRRVEGGFAQLDGLVSNPECPSHIRHLGIDGVVSNVLNSAKKLGIKGVIAFTANKSTIVRASSLGFSSSDAYTMLALRF